MKRTKREKLGRPTSAEGLDSTILAQAERYCARALCAERVYGQNQSDVGRAIGLAGDVDVIEIRMSHASSLGT